MNRADKGALKYTSLANIGRKFALYMLGCLFVVTCTCWIRSLWWIDELSVITKNHGGIAVISADNSIAVISYQPLALQQGGGREIEWQSTRLDGRNSLTIVPEMIPRRGCGVRSGFISGELYGWGLHYAIVSSGLLIILLLLGAMVIRRRYRA